MRCASSMNPSGKIALQNKKIAVRLPGGGAHLLQILSSSIVACADLPVRAAKDPGGDGDEEEDEGKDDVGLEGEDEEGEQRKAPDDQIERHDGVELFGRGAGDRVGAAGGIGRGQPQRGKLQHAEAQPEDGKEAAHHHGEEVAHDPFEDGGQNQQDGADEEENAAV